MQKALAEASHVSRVTIVNLEKGKVGDIGAVKLAQIAENVGMPLFSSENRMDFIKMTLGPKVKQQNRNADAIFHHLAGFPVSDFPVLNQPTPAVAISV